ncbi:hypothetical protein HJG60_011209 [Phyllostomus discolor]|uniref:Uncharacterized protein n=1 Tax=Phyllostomus discolor TaxID=89673 RepID=A0A833ZWB4_9CHIR|nr:hypothetical protein HJG60_011209 [Phyllostomus discolor]
MLRLYSRYISSIITKQQNFNLWNHDITPLGAQSNMLFYYRSFYRVYRAKLGEICTSQSSMSAVWEQSTSFTISNTVQGEELGRYSVVVMVDKHCYHKHTDSLPQRTHIRGEQSEQGTHTKPAGAMTALQCTSTAPCLPSETDRCATAGT